MFAKLMKSTISTDSRIYILDVVTELGGVGVGRDSRDAVLHVC